MGLQFGLTARFRYVTEPWGEDVIYHFHRQISLAAVGLVVAHPLILFAVRPELRAQLELRRRARMAAPASPALSIVSRSSRSWRRRCGAREWNIRYEAWHLTHIVLGRRGRSRLGLAAHGRRRSFYAARIPGSGALWIGLAICSGSRLLALRAHRQAALHAPPPVPRSRTAPGARRHARTLGDARPTATQAFRFTPRPVRLADRVAAEPVQDHRAPVLHSSSSAAADGRTGRDDDPQPGRLHRVHDPCSSCRSGQRVYLDGPYGAFTLDRNPADMHVLSSRRGRRHTR